MNFSKAKEAIWKLERSRDSDWYNWWFGDSNPHRYNIKGDKKRNRVPWISKRLVKKIFGGILAGSIASYAIALVVSYYMNINNNKFEGIPATVFAIGIFAAILLLPSLKGLKFFDVELSTAPPSGRSELDPVPLLDPKMPAEYPLEPFKAPLRQPLHLPSQYPLRSVNMPLEYLSHHVLLSN